MVSDAKYVQRCCSEPADSRSATVRAELNKILADTAPLIVKGRIADVVRTADAGQLAAVAALLEPLKTVAPTRVHCVRCHETYDTTRNTPKSCEIPHPESGYPEEYSYRYKPTVGYEMLCCGLKWEADDDDDIDPPKRYCIRAKHTTDARLVEQYWRADAVDGDEEDDEAYERERDRRDPTVQTCAQAGCKI